MSIEDVIRKYKKRVIHKTEVMNDYKESHDPELLNSISVYEKDIAECEQIISALELAKAKAEGRLVVLPYPVGVHLFEIRKGKIHEFEYTQYELWRDSEGNIRINLLAQVNAMAKEEVLRWIGKTVFLTREAAEKALDELQKNDEGEI